MNIEKHIQQCVEQHGCWLYPTRRADGYARVRQGGVKVYLHRAVYEYMRGAIPAGLELDHLCRQRNCINPWHCDPVTHAENVRRYQALKTHCPKGHEYAGENLTYNSKGGRKCKQCEREYNATYRAGERA